MKFKPNERLMTRAVYLFFSLAGTILFTLLITNLGTIFAKLGEILGFIMPVVYAFVIAFLLNPLCKVYETKLISKIKIRKKPLSRKIRRILSLVLTYLTALLVIVFFLWLVIPSFGRSLEGIQKQIPGYIKAVENSFDSAIAWIGQIPTVGADQDTLGLFEKIGNEMVGMIEGQLGKIASWIGTLAPTLMAMAGNIVSFLLNFVLGMIISIYFLMDKERLIAQVRKLTRAIFPQRASDFLYEFGGDTYEIFSNYIVGKSIDAFAVGVLCFIGMLFIHRELAVLIAVIVGISNFIPYFGPIIGAIPGGLLLLSISPSKTVIYVIFIIVLQQIDGNIVEPAILGDTMGLSPLLVIFSIFLFGGLMGLVGVFFGVPIFAMIYSLIGRMVNRRLERQNLPTDTKKYASPDNPLE